jgi:calcineurin-like phosphoesterase family protein
MNEKMIENWNKVVHKNDQVYHLGDIAMNVSSAYIDHILSQLNGRKFLLIGNHDGDVASGVLEKHFEIIEKQITRSFGINGRTHKVIMSHYPMRSWDGAFHGTMHFHGHVHGRFDASTDFLGACDVGVDSWNYAPVSLEKVVETVTKRQESRRFYIDGMLGM